MTFSRQKGIEVKWMARILVIDDDSDIRAVLEQLLISAGYEVTLAADGREGMTQQRANPADLVITDLYMPVQDGSETIRELRSHFPQVAIIAMSGRTESGEILSIAQHLPEVGLLMKPFHPNEVMAAVARALATPSM